MISTWSGGKIHGIGGEILPRVLVIDDEPLVRWSLVAGLRHAGFDAVSAGTPEDALGLAGEAPVPMIVLLDIGLWGIDVRELLAGIRRRAPDCRVFLLVVEGQEAPVFDDVEVIRKPFDLHAVVARVRAALPYTAHGAKLAV
jgi:two-component system response regulator AtoC